MSVREINISSTIVRLVEHYDDIVFIELGKSQEVNLVQAKEVVACRIEIANNKKHYFILDTSNVKRVSADAKQYLQDEEGGLKNIVGAAFVASNPVAAMIANIFVKTPKNFPARFFFSRAHALAWILKYREQKSRFADGSQDM